MLALLITAALGQETVAELDLPELDAFRSARGRFAERLGELETDTRSYIDFREHEERDKLSDGYNTLIDELSAEEKALRTVTIARFEEFLADYPSVPYASHVRFRLADLYYEVASETWQAEAKDYFAKLDDPDLTEEELDALGEQPMRDLGPALALYERIITENLRLPPEQRYERLDGTYVMLGFVYNDANNLQYDEKLARQAFEDLVAHVPDSELVDRSQLFLGNFAFAENRFDEAMASYEAVVDKGPDGSKYYMEGLYQLAWARYKLNRFDEALTLFTELLDVSHQNKLDSGRESAFAPDAARFMAFSFADLGFDQDRPAQDIAHEYFERVGERPYERQVYVDLADVLVRYTRPDEAIATYERLQLDPRWTLEPDNPAHQIALIDLYQNSVARDLALAGEARLAFIERFSEGTPWWEANRSDPEVLDVARRHVESSLLDVAVEYRVRAQESLAPADFAMAAEKYEDYLDNFPISDDFYHQQWFLADSLKMANELDRAIVEFESLVRSSPYHDYGDGARYASMEVRYQQMLGLGHDPGVAPSDAEVTGAVGDGEDAFDVYALSEDRAHFVTAVDAVVGHEFAEEGHPELPDYRTEVEQRRPGMMYLAGQLYFHHHQLEEARKRFEALIAEHPRSLEASYAAGLLVDSYLLEGDLASVRAATLRFTVNPPGPTADIDPERFKGTLEGTTFKLALEQAEGGDHLGAAESFLAFREEFPASDFDVDALYNAAFYYQQGGKVEQSNALYEQFVSDNPDDGRSKGLLFRIAANYESAFELAKAEDFYDRILRHPDATDSEKADAQYNRSFLLIGLGRHKEAAQGFETYEKRYPEQQDREQVLWLAGEQWEEVSPAKAIDFYERYLRKYPAESPDHAIEAEYRIAQLLREMSARPRAVAKQDAAILARFDQLTQAGEEIGGAGHKYAAAADFPRLEKLYEDYAADALTGNEDKDAVLLNETKPAGLKAVEAEIKAFIGRFQSFEYNSGALLLQARAALYMADLGLSITCPAGLSEEDCWLYEDILQEKVFPQYYEIEQVGIDRLTQLVDAAKQAKRHSPFIDDALTELNRRRPAEFPAAKLELEGEADAAIPVPFVPRDLPEVEPVVEAPEEGTEEGAGDPVEVPIEEPEGEEAP